MLEPTNQDVRELGALLNHLLECGNRLVILDARPVQVISGCIGRPDCFGRTYGGQSELVRSKALCGLVMARDGGDWEWRCDSISRAQRILESSILSSKDTTFRSRRTAIYVVTIIGVRW
jgi:hypothetical protein